MDKALEEFSAAMKLFQKRDYPRAREGFRGVIEKYPGEKEICDRASGLMAVCDRQVHTEVPQARNAEEDCTQGVVFLNEGNVEEALSHFRKAAENGGGARAWYLEACALAQAGRKDEAVSSLRKSVEADPGNRSRAANEKDFEGLREDPGFQDLMGGSRGTTA
jgi:Flp pilus assembly protein TadD